MGFPLIATSGERDNRARPRLTVKLQAAGQHRDMP